MQFSIQRPTLPSAESHPEERLYRRLDVTTWLRHLNHNGQVEEEYKLRKVCWSVCAPASFTILFHLLLCAYSRALHFDAFFWLCITHSESH